MSTRIFSQQTIADLSQREQVNFVNALSGFKSANLLGTQSTRGINNLALVSSAFHVGANPPLMGMIMRPHTVTRDSLQNIKDTSVFTLNHVNQGILKQAHQCAARYAPEQSEFDSVGLTPQMSNVVAAPFVQQSKVKIALEVAQITLIEQNETEFVLGKIVEVIIENDCVLNDGYIDLEQAGSAVVSGLDSYHITQRVDRFSYPKPNKPIHSIWNRDDTKS